MMFALLWRLLDTNMIQMSGLCLISLKAVVTHNGNKFQSVPLANTSKTKEYYDNMMLVLEKI
jgi:hypothetical protein